VKRRVRKHPPFLGADRLVSTPNDSKVIRANKGIVRRSLKVNGKCKFCNGDKVVKDGKKGGKQQYKCMECGHKFVNPDRHAKMRAPKGAIATALELYYDGLSLRQVARHIQKIYKVKVNASTVWRWIQKYTPLVKDFMQSLEVETGGCWHVDETCVKVKGEKWWYWEVIDRDTRMILGTHLSKSREFSDAEAVFLDAYKTSKQVPGFVICDGLQSYYGGLKRVFGGMTVQRHINFIQMAGVSKQVPNNNNMIERFHNTLKARYKVMRGLQNPRQLLDGFCIHYNLIRPHQTLKTTPGRTGGLKLPFNDGWGDMIDWATHYQTLTGAN
jgi:putative transposase